VPIEIPDPTPTGLLLAWKPTVLSLRLDTGTGDSRFGSESFEPGRGLARFTFQILGEKPFFGRIEVEGGQFKTSEARLGSTGADLTGRFLAGAATRITSGVVLTAGAGVLTRYEWGRPTGGVPTIGMFGVASNLELDVRLLPAISLACSSKAPSPPSPTWRKRTSAISPMRASSAAIQLSYDVSPSMAVDVGYDFTRWHAAFTNSTILGSTDRASSSRAAITPRPSASVSSSGLEPTTEASSLAPGFWGVQGERAPLGGGAGGAGSQSFTSKVQTLVVLTIAEVSVPAVPLLR